MNKKEAFIWTVISLLIGLALFAIVVALGYLGFGLLWHNGHKVLGAIVTFLPIIVATAILIYVEYRNL